MRTKILIIIALIGYFLMPVGVLLASEDPPGPDFITFLFGGQIYYKKLGITIGISYRQPIEIDFMQKWLAYNPKEPPKLYPGAELRIDVVSENGRRSDDKMVTTIAFSDSKEQKMQVVHNFTGMYGTVVYRIPKYNTNYVFMRVYTDGGERKTQDNYAGWCFWVEPNTFQPMLANNSNYSINMPTENLQNETGDVEIQFFEQSPASFSTVIVPKITLFHNDKPFIEKINAQGVWLIRGIPVGKIKISYKDENNSWMVKNISSSYSVQKELDSQSQKYFNVFVWNVEKGKTIHINVVRRSKGGVSQ